MHEVFAPIRVAISACLLGSPVRFDGGHKKNAFLTDVFGRFVEWVPICPEAESGLGTPREAMRLVKTEGAVRLMTVKTRRDLTEVLDTFSDARVARLVGRDLSGYVLKKDSPSCGLERVKVYENDVPVREGRGRFAARLVDRFRDLPVEEEGRLSDPLIRENFIERVFAYSRLRTLEGEHVKGGTLVHFHTAHKLLLMAHSPRLYQQLGQLVATAGALPSEETRRQYAHLFMTALKVLATRRRHVNVLQHMAGYFTDKLDRASRGELAETIEDYRRELVPLIVPITLIRHHVRVHQVNYLAGQYYLEPHPKELMLRNHV